MITWLESTSAEFSFSTLRQRTNLVTLSRTGTVFCIDEDGNTFTRNTSASTYNGFTQTVGRTENQSATTVLEYISQFQSTSADANCDASQFFQSSKSSLTHVESRSVTWTETYTSVSGTLTIVPNTNINLPPLERRGTFYFSTTVPTISIATSTTSSEQRSYSTTTITDSQYIKYSTSQVGENVFFVLTTEPTTTIRSTQSNATLTFDTTTRLTETEHSAQFYNTIYQAQTKPLNTNNLREVFWVVTKQTSETTNSKTINPYIPAIDVATSTTKTTAFAQTNTISLYATTRPESLSMFVSRFTNPSIYQTLSARTSGLDFKETTIANYEFIPPETIDNFVQEFSTEKTNLFFTNIGSATIDASYEQTKTTQQWHTSAILDTVSFPNIIHDSTRSIWTFREATTTTQNKYLTDILVAFHPPEYFTSGETTTTATDATTTSITSSWTSEFFVGGNSIKNKEFATFGTSIAISPPTFSVFYPRGAAIRNNSGFILNANLPFTCFGFSIPYTALKSRNITTQFPYYWEDLGDEDGNPVSLSLSEENISFTRKTGEDTSNTSSGVAQFSIQGGTQFSSYFTTGRLGGVTGASWAQRVLAGAYKVIGTNQTITVSTSGGVSDGNNSSATSFWSPVSFIVPVAQSNSMLLWTAPRNTTNTIIPSLSF